MVLAHHAASISLLLLGAVLIMTKNLIPLFDLDVVWLPNPWGLGFKPLMGGP